ncbi:MAG: phosphate signaling complex protein PhoU [Phycisphaerae bacterium]|nr:phosphate signaling complex protein PhoU [Phycisphaerae bacterium]
MASLSNELMNLRRLLLTMAAEVEQRVNQALDGLLKHDLRSAEAVREGDDPIDQLDVDIESECATILALHQPVASDLRYVMASLRINADLEKIADLARGIAKKVIKLEYLKPLERPPVLQHIAGSLRSMVADTMQALADGDKDLALQVRGSDKNIDRQYKELMTWAAQQMAVPGHDPKALLDVIGIVRTIERIADLCANIAESVVFAANGTIVRHQPVEQDEPRT